MPSQQLGKYALSAIIKCHLFFSECPSMEAVLLKTLEKSLTRLSDVVAGRMWERIDSSSDTTLLPMDISTSDN